ncbi:ribonuclease III [Spiroplasma endosymbiont of Crioceris asparagi]|uniref:ribonuclease III n=1 Tax=Spiroplasma endosymbiont of Crioceris asparagi TaxID=3066286 RepID=UPI0030D05E64
MRELLLEYGIEIKEMSYFDEALTHNSYANEHGTPITYQRLEFLGDAILQLKVSEYLFNNFKTYNEGLMTKYRSAIVREESLSYIVKNMGLGKLIKLGAGEIQSKGHEKNSILADIYESVTAAIYLDSGMEVVEQWLNKTLFISSNISYFLDKTHDYKSELQELIQLEKRDQLVYKVINCEKNEYNQQNFTVNVSVENIVYGTGEGNNKKAAEQNAAKDALSKLRNLKGVKHANN